MEWKKQQFFLYFVVDKENDMEKTKINMQTDDCIIRQDENILSNQYKKALNYLLSDDKMSDDFWEEDSNAKKDMESFLKDDGLQRLLFMGEYRTGKSFFLKKYFGLSTDETFCIKKYHLFIFLSGDGNGIVENQDIMEYFADEFKKICEFYNTYFLKQNDFVSKNEKKFYRFIVETKGDVLQRPWLSNDEAESAYISEIKDLKIRKRLTYYIMKLKYYLLLDKKIKNIVLIYDNITSIDLYNKIIEKVDGCMRNYVKTKYQGYEIKSIFVTNYDIYRDMPNQSKVGFDKILLKRKSLNIEGVFDDRFNRAKEFGEEWMKERGFDISSLCFIKSELDKLNSRFNQKYKKMILGLSMYDKKVALQYYKKIMFNQTWIAKKRFSYAKDVQEINNNFLFNNITCIRALGCGNEKVYNPKQQYDFTIPNILYNTEEEEYGIYNLLLIKYFVRNRENFEYKHGKDATILEKCRKIWGDNKEYIFFEKALYYLLQMNIVEYHTIEGDKGISSKKVFNITIKGAELWDMLQSDSLLMELCREDYYRYPNTQNNMESSYQLLCTEKQNIIFEDLLYMVKDFNEMENKLYKIVQDRGFSAEFENLFGKRKMSFYLLEGIKKSISYSCNRSNEFLRRQCEYIENEVRDSF